jgi:acetyltransferase-like isoleucine patch superfamily enzyme
MSSSDSTRRPRSNNQLMLIRSDEFRQMSDRVVVANQLTSMLNGLPFDDATGKAHLFEQILGRPLPLDVTIYPPFFIDNGLNLTLGDRVFINQNCTFMDYAGITIGAGTMIGPRCTFITMGHPVDPDDRRMYLTGGPIVIDENVWIGAGAMILPGVTIGHDSVIAAGTTVVENVPPRSLVAGPKASLVRQW